MNRTYAHARRNGSQVNKMSKLPRRVGSACQINNIGFPQYTTTLAIRITSGKRLPSDDPEQQPIREGERERN